jgi:hypothetical protein
MTPPEAATPGKRRRLEPPVGKTLPLRTEEPSKAASESQTILRLQIDLAKAWQDFVQQEFSGLLRVFFRLNFCVLALILTLAMTDVILTVELPPEAHYQRLITDKIILALIAAYAAQLGSLAIAVGTQLLRLRNETLSTAAAKAAVNTAGDAAPKPRPDVAA